VISVNISAKHGIRSFDLILRWDIITIGNLSRNRYWGEGDDSARRPALCTTTLITGNGYRLLVDPSIEDIEKMAA
jgi:hypothetical protein